MLFIRMTMFIVIMVVLSIESSLNTHIDDKY